MKAFELSQLMAKQLQSDDAYLEFLRVPSMSMGLYTLPAGSTDPQEPHSEDEVYYVVSGRATLQVADEEYPVQPGSIVFVEAGVDHEFHTITEDLTTLVFFAPAEGTTTN